MRRIILAFVLLFFGLTLCFADKVTTYTSVSDVKVIMNFNVPKNVDGTLYYVPIFLKITGIATTSDGGERTVTIEEEVGELLETVTPPDTIHTLLSVEFLQEAYSDFYSEALDQTVPSEE
jgi:hypothetical protein